VEWYVTFIFVATVRTATVCRTCVGWLRWQCNAAGFAQLCLASKPLVDFSFTWHNANGTHEAVHRNAYARHLLGNSFTTIQLPVCNERLGVHIWQEAKTRNDGGVAILVWVDVDELNCQHVATFCAFDVDRARHWVDQVDVDSSDVFWLRIDVQVRIQRVACVNDYQITWFCTSYRLNRWVITIETVWILFAMFTFLFYFNNRLSLYISGVSQCNLAKTCCQNGNEKSW